MARQTGTLSAAGSVTLTKPQAETLALVQISGTHAGFTFVLEGSIDGTNYVAVAAIDAATGQIVTGTISPAENASAVWKVPAEGFARIRLRLTAISTGSVSVAIVSSSYVGLPISYINNASSQVAGTLSSKGVAGTDSTLPITGAAGSGSGAGAAVSLTGGLGGATGAGGASSVVGGAGGSTSGTGGAASVIGGAGTAGNANGGAVSILGGAKHSAGTDGAISIGTSNTSAITIGAASIPTNAPGPVNSAAGASTAAAGSTTSDAGVLPAGTARVYPTTAADDTKGVRVHASDKVTGRTIFIGNGVSNKILKVYAPSGGAINGASADAAFSSASGKGVIMHCLDATANTWLAW